MTADAKEATRPDSPGYVADVPGLVTLPHPVLATEWEHIRARRAAVGSRDDPGTGGPGLTAPQEGSDAAGDARAPERLVGLALSGGGIRSATFALGVLQTLAARGVLPVVDFLSTVSGGGYIGGCLSSLLTPAPATPAPTSTPDVATKVGFGVTPGTFPLFHRDVVHHLRTHGDFLIARRGLFRFEALRAVGVMSFGIVASLAYFCGVLTCLVALWLTIVRWLVGPARWPCMVAAYGQGDVVQLLTTAAPGGWGDVPVLAFVGAASIVACVVIARAGTRLNVGAEGAVRRRLTGVVIGLLGVPIVALMAAGNFGACRYFEAGGALTLVPAWCLGTWLGAILVNIAWSRFGSRQWTMTTRGFLNGAAGATLWVVVACAASAGVAALMALSKRVDLNANTLGVLGGALAGVARFLAGSLRQEGSHGHRGLGALLRRGGLRVVMPILFLVLWTLVARGLIGDSADGSSRRIGIAVMVSAGAVALLAFLVDYNRISPHYFYRDRLSEAYLQTDVAGSGPKNPVRRDDRLLLHDLLGRAGAVPHGNAAPYLLIQAAVNLPGSDDLARRDRKSDRFLFSRAYCGSHATGFVRTEHYCAPDPTQIPGGRGVASPTGDVKLAKAMTISGAAAGSAMGFQTSFALALATTALNVRLGYWLPNPAWYPAWMFAGTSLRPFVTPGVRTPSAKIGGMQWARLLFRELSGTASEHEAYVNLSDGGHTGDNLGLVPLLQRRCKLIIVADAEQDPEYGFASLAAAIRQANVDENIRVEIDTGSIVPGGGPPGSREHFVIGRVHYPAVPSAGAFGAATTGWIVYLKSSYFGADEPQAVRSYQAARRAFPHETTADQFFDDDQFEAYRELGSHVATCALRSLWARSVAPGAPGQAPAALPAAAIDWEPVLRAALP